MADLNGEILELERQKRILEGEIDNITNTTRNKMGNMGAEAASQIQQQVDAIREQFDSLLIDALKAGEAVEIMRQMSRKGEQAEKGLKDFITEVKGRMKVS